MNTASIKVHYRSIDRFSQSRTFKTLEGAQKFAQKWVGPTPELGWGYAVSGDGVGRITVQGAPIVTLFPLLMPQQPATDPNDDYWASEHAAEQGNSGWY